MIYDQKLPKPARPIISSLSLNGLGWTGHEEHRSSGSLVFQSQLLQDVRACPGNNFPTVELSCKEFGESFSCLNPTSVAYASFCAACGRRRLAERPIHGRNSKRIVGGQESSPGTWPFLAALLGGPEHVFYCAGVLISDQWVLSASHCVGK